MRCLCEILIRKTHATCGFVEGCRGAACLSRDVTWDNASRSFQISDQSIAYPDLSDLPCRCRERFGAPAQRSQKSRRLRRCRFRQASRAKKSRGPIMLTRRTFCTSAGCTGAIAGFGLNTGLARADNALGTLDPAFGEMEK